MRCFLIFLILISILVGCSYSKKESLSEVLLVVDDSLVLQKKIPVKGRQIKMGQPKGWGTYDSLLDSSTYRFINSDVLVSLLNDRDSSIYVARLVHDEASDYLDLVNKSLSNVDNVVSYTTDCFIVKQYSFESIHKLNFRVLFMFRDRPNKPIFDLLFMVEPYQLGVVESVLGSFTCVKNN